MKYISVLRCTSLFACIASAPAQSTKVISGATLMNGAGAAPIQNALIVIKGTHIAHVGPAGTTKIPKGAETIDVRGKFIIPGLADMHNHLGNGYERPGGGQAPQNYRQNLTQLLALGFTTILCTSYVDRDLANTARHDATPLPRLWGLGSQSFSTAGGHMAQRDINLPKTPEEARQQIRSGVPSAGVAAIKILYSDNSHRRPIDGRPPLLVMKREIMEALVDEAHKLGMKAYVHAPTLRHAREAVEAGADVLVHSVADGLIDEQFIALMKKNRTSYITTLSIYMSAVDGKAWIRRLEEIDMRKVVPKTVYERLAGDTGAKELQTFTGVISDEQARYLGKNLRKIYDAGIPVLSGTDTSVFGVLLGVSSQMELMLMVEAGLKPSEVLRTATINAARMLGREKEQGTLEAGKLADLVILDADPLADILNITKIHRVIKGGVIYDPIQLLLTKM
jgi:imidazolonepropionase-like amidohydrolase